MGRLAGKVAIVTGSARGMGAVEARLFAREGAAVVVCDVLDERGRKTAADICAGGAAAIYLHLDVTSQPDWQALAEQAKAWRGRIDILVNNAGINIRGGIDRLVLDDWHKVLAVNLTGPLLGMKTIAPVMRETGGGSIVNIASNAALLPAASAAYTSGKWGLRGLGKVAAAEFAPWQVRVNTVCPGVVPTELNEGQPYLKTVVGKTPLGRIGAAEDVANAVLFLASDESNFITGADLPVDGGFIVGAAR